MRHSVDLVEFESNHAGEESFLGVVDDTSALDDIDSGIGNETLSSPASIVRVREMVAIEDSDNLSTSVQSEEEVEVIGLGFGADDLGHAKKTTVLLLHLNEFGLKRFDGFGGIVEEVDAELFARVNNLLKCVVDLVLDNVLLVWQVCDNHNVKDGEKVVGSGKFSTSVDSDGSRSRIAKW